MSSAKAQAKDHMPIDIRRPALLPGAFSVEELGANGTHDELESPVLRCGDLEPFRRHRLLAKRYLPFLKTLTDFDIAAEVGFHELSATPLTVKHLLLLELAPPVTVFRRLNRLCEMEIILRTQSQRDRRVHELRLSPAVHRLFALYSHTDEAG